MLKLQLFQVINGEEYPPFVHEIEGFPDHVYLMGRKLTYTFAIGYPFFNFVPGTMLFAILWTREHNRVCEILVKEHPEWEDEQLYQTAKLVILGKCVT